MSRIVPAGTHGRCSMTPVGGPPFRSCSGGTVMVTPPLAHRISPASAARRDDFPVPTEPTSPMTCPFRAVMSTFLSSIWLVLSSSPGPASGGGSPSATAETFDVDLALRRADFLDVHVGFLLRLLGREEVVKPSERSTTFGKRREDRRVEDQREPQIVEQRQRREDPRRLQDRLLRVQRQDHHRHDRRRGGQDGNQGSSKGHALSKLAQLLVPSLLHGRGRGRLPVLHLEHLNTGEGLAGQPHAFVRLGKHLRSVLRQLAVRPQVQRDDGEEDRQPRPDARPQELHEKRNVPDDLEQPVPGDVHLRQDRLHATGIHLHQRRDSLPARLVSGARGRQLEHLLRHR
eukprot:scaffold1231_cov187-Pinguiococcus_pyrenoidosus.AAC.24